MIGISDIKEIFDKTHESLNEIGLLARWFNKKYDFTGAAGDYKKRLDELYDNVKIIGMSEPIKLRSIYTRVNILEKITALKSISVKELEQYYDKDRRTFTNNAQTLEGIEVVNKLSNLVLLGKPGAGKTTFLKHLVLQAADGLLKVKRIPIFISLKEWSDSDKSLMAFIVEQFDICRFEKAEPFIERMLDLGKCFLLLDGLDEVSSDKEDNIIRQVRDFSNKYKDNAFIISCRIAAYKYILQHFREIELADFDNGQIKHFINSWFGSNTEKAKLCWKAMENNPSIKELACVPLLLTLLCLNFDDTMEFPKNKGELYQVGIDALLTKLDISRNIKRQQIYKDFSLNRKITLLSQIAATSFERNEYFMPQRVVEEYIADFIKNIPGTKEEDLMPSSEAILKSIEAHHGILIERAEKIYSFSHLTFQEYFTAKNIVENKDKGSFEKLAENHLLDPKWREVILLTLGIVGNADSLLLAVKKKVDSLVDDKLGYLLKQIFENSELTKILAEIGDLLHLENLSPLKINLIKIAVFLPLIPNLTHAFNLGIDLDCARAGALDLASATDRASALDRANALAQTRDVVRARVLELASVLELPPVPGFKHTNALEITRTLNVNWLKEIVEVSNKIETNVVTKEDTNNFNKVVDKGIPEINRLNNYLYGTNLLLECLKSDCYTSKETREKIMSELLGLAGGKL